MKHQNSVLPVKVAVLSAFQKGIYNFLGVLTDELVGQDKITIRTLVNLNLDVYSPARI